MSVGRARPHLAIDIKPLLEDHWTGIPVFTRRLAHALLRDGRVELSFTHELCQIPSELALSALAAGSGSYFRDEVERRAGQWEPPKVKSAIFFPSVKGEIEWPGRQASTVHDMSTLFMPENHDDANIAYHLDNFARELATNDVTFCVSESTRAALESAFPSTAGRTRVVPQYVDWPDSFAQMERNAPSLAFGRYAVVVGTVEPRKNLGLLLRALRTPEIERSPLKFIVIGKKGWLVDQFFADLTPAQRERVIFTGFVTEFVKFRLIRNAEFLVYPSVYEGFGIPALEAMSLGKPVLAAMTSSLPEIIGEAGLYFDPFSVKEFAAAFTEMQNPRKQAELAPHALAQARRFDAAAMARPIVDWLE